MVVRHSGASLEDGKKITLPPLPLDFDLKTQNRDHPSFKNARVRQGCAPPNPKTPRIWGFHFCHHLRRAKRGGPLVRTYFALPPPCRPRELQYNGVHQQQEEVPQLNSLVRQLQVDAVLWCSASWSLPLTSMPLRVSARRRSRFL